MFWELSLAEVYDLIESYRRKQEQETEKNKQQLKVDAVFNADISATNRRVCCFII